VDARGVLLGNMFGVEQQGDYARIINGAAARSPAQDTAMLVAQRVAEHGTMDVLAKETGGRAVYDDNGFKEGMANAVSDGPTSIPSLTLRLTTNTTVASATSKSALPRAPSRPRLSSTIGGRTTRTTVPPARRRARGGSA
jgi:hypothetical protein